MIDGDIAWIDGNTFVTRQGPDTYVVYQSPEDMDDEEGLSWPVGDMGSLVSLAEEALEEAVEAIDIDLDDPDTIQRTEREIEILRGFIRKYGSGVQKV